MQDLRKAENVRSLKPLSEGQSFDKALCICGLLKTRKAASKYCRPRITWDRKRHKQESYQCDNVIKPQNGRHKVVFREKRQAREGIPKYHSSNSVWHENIMSLDTAGKIWELNYHPCAIPQPNIFALLKPLFASAC